MSDIDPQEFGRLQAQPSAHDQEPEGSRHAFAPMTRDEMRAAVAEGVEAVLTNEHVWAKVFTVLQKQAAQRTGRFVLGGLVAVLKKAMWVAIFVGIAYSIGGWTLLKAVWAGIVKG